MMGNYGIPTDEQWGKMQQFIKSDKYKKENFFVFETQAVGDREVPGRYTRILPEVLEIMKQDAQKGVSLMLNHNWSQLGVQSIPIGKVFDARLGPGTQDGETTALYVTQYILRDDSKVDGYSKNDIINLIETGIMSDTSIGWGTDTECYICNICGHQYYGSQCDHCRGVKYVVNENTNEVKQCIIEVHAPKQLHAGNNILMENSVVFDGAYPNAQIQSSVAIQNATSNNGVKLLDEKEELQDNQKIYANSCNNHLDLYYIPFEKGGKAMDEKEMLSQQEPDVETTENVEEVTEPVETQSNEPEATTEEATETTTEAVTTEETQSNQTDEPVETTEETQTVETQSAISFEASELSEIFGEEEANKEMLLRLAKDGKMYRDNVINEALKSGVRTLGNSFNQETFKKTFELMSTEDIKAMGEAWEKEVSEKFSFTRVSKDTMSKDSSNNSSEVDYSFLKTSTY